MKEDSMKRAVTVDTSVFVSSFFHDEVNNKASREFFAFLKENRIQVFIPILVILESLHTYYRKTKNIKETDKINERFMFLNISKSLQIVSTEASFLANFIAHHTDFDLKAADTIITVSAIKTSTPLVSWDKKMIEQCKNKVKAYNPREFIKLKI